MFYVSDMTPEQRLNGAALLMLLRDAMDGPMNTPAPPQSSEAFVQWESRLVSGDQIRNMDETYQYLCQAINADAAELRQRFIDGEIDRQALEALFLKWRRE